MNHFRKIFFVVVLATGVALITPAPQAQAAIPIAQIIKEGVRKVIRAVDLMIQRLQNKTIALQNAAKVLENKLSKLKLNEIADWTERQRQLYQEYYDELWKVRNTIAMYDRVKKILQRQAQLAKEYKSTWELVRQDKHFTQQEIDYMYRVYTGILDESVKNIDQVLLVINSFKMQMDDASRLRIIVQVGERIETNYADLKRFNNKAIQLSLNRAKDEHEVKSMKKLYGLE